MADRRLTQVGEWAAAAAGRDKRGRVQMSERDIRAELREAGKQVCRERREAAELEARGWRRRWWVLTGISAICYVLYGCGTNPTAPADPCLKALREYNAGPVNPGWERVITTTDGAISQVPKGCLAEVEKLGWVVGE